MMMNGCLIGLRLKEQRNRSTIPPTNTNPASLAVGAYTCTCTGGNEMRMKYCSIEWTQDGAATTFDGDIRCPSTPHDTHHYHVIAHRCGCGDDVRQYCRDHELAHVILSEWFQQCAPASLLETSVHGNALDWGTNMMEECT